MKDIILYENDIDDCPLTFALNIIGGKWRLPIIWNLSKEGVLRYNELKRHITGITDMMLTQCLKDLEAHNIVVRKQYMVVPPKVEYSLTEQGQALIPSLKSLANWGKSMKNTEIK